MIGLGPGFPSETQMVRSFAVPAKSARPRSSRRLVSPLQRRLRRQGGSGSYPQPLAPPAPSLWLAPRRSARLRGRELRSIWIQSAGNGSGGGRQARVQHHRAHLQRAPQRRPHRVPHLQAPPVSTTPLPSAADFPLPRVTVVSRSSSWTKS